MSIWKPELTTKILTKEYIDWIAKYGIGRDSSDLRFGQMMCNNYLAAGVSLAEIFYEEDPAIVYSSILLNLISTEQR